MSFTLFKRPEQKGELRLLKAIYFYGCKLAGSTQAVEEYFNHFIDNGANAKFVQLRKDVYVLSAQPVPIENMEHRIERTSRDGDNERCAQTSELRDVNNAYNALASFNDVTLPDCATVNPENHATNTDEELAVRYAASFFALTPELAQMPHFGQHYLNGPQTDEEDANRPCTSKRARLS